MIRKHSTARLSTCTASTLSPKTHGGEFADEKEITFKIRHTPDFTHGRIRRIGDLYRIESDNKIQGIAPGQYGVVYDKDHRLCLGSGMIIDEEK